MGKQEKLIAKILNGSADANIAFTDLRNLLKSLGFTERIRGDHYIFTKAGIEDILNLQPLKAKAKAYQVKQVRGVMLKYKLGGQNDTSL
jgi:virulence-associated protein VapD